MIDTVELNYFNRYRGGGTVASRFGQERWLQECGYACGYTGKWHLCAEADKRTRFQADYVMSLPSTLGFVGHDFPGHGAGGFSERAYRDYLEENGWSVDIDSHEAAFGHEAGI